MGSRMISSALAAEWSMSISMSIPQWQARKGRHDAGKVIASRSMQPTYHQIYSKRAGAEADRSQEKFTPGHEVESAPHHRNIVRLRRAPAGHLGLGHPHREHPADPKEQEIERQKDDQACLRRARPKVLHDEPDEIIGDVADHHEHDIVDDE